MAWANEYQRHIIVIFIATLPPVLLFSDVELAVLYSPRFIAAAPFVALFVPTEVITLLSGSYQALILADNRVRFHVGQNITAQILTVAIAALTIPRLGLAGAGLAVMAAPVFMFGSTLWYLRRQFGVRPTREAAHMCWLALGMLLVCGARQYNVSRHDSRKAGSEGCSVHRSMARRLCGHAGGRSRPSSPVARQRTRAGLALLARRGRLA